MTSCELVATSLREEMERRNLSQEETARQAKIVTARQLTRIMGGEHCPSLERAAALSTVLGVPIDQLFRIQVRTKPARPRVKKPGGRPRNARRIA